MKLDVYFKEYSYLESMKGFYFQIKCMPDTNTDLVKSLLIKSQSQKLNDHSARKLTKFYIHQTGNKR
jgi:hypothetical protein